jgi:F-type H+-transporting ATPase subunit gamma
VATRLEARGEQPRLIYSLPGSMKGLPETAERIIIDIDAWRAEGACDQVLLFYNRREPLQRSGPRMARLLPLDVRYLRALAHHPWESRVLPTFTMDRGALFAALVRQHLFTTVYRAGADSLAAEHAARLAAMQSAERSIADRLEEMNADYRQARQNAITSEILDIVAGYEVLRSQKRH